MLTIALGTTEERTDELISCDKVSRNYALSSTCVTCSCSDRGTQVDRPRVPMYKWVSIVLYNTINTNFS